MDAPSKWWLVLIEVVILLAFGLVWYRAWRRDWLRRNPPENEDWWWEEKYQVEAEQRKADAFTAALKRNARERRG